MLRTFPVKPMYPTRSPQSQIRGIHKNLPLISEECKLLQRSFFLTIAFAENSPAFSRV
jgi:hypothetical protein